MDAQYHRQLVYSCMCVLYALQRERSTYYYTDLDEAWETAQVGAVHPSTISNVHEVDMIHRHLLIQRATSAMCSSVPISLAVGLS